MRRCRNENKKSDLRCKKCEYCFDRELEQAWKKNSGYRNVGEFVQREAGSNTEPDLNWHDVPWRHECRKNPPTVIPDTAGEPRTAYPILDDLYGCGAFSLGSSDLCKMD